MPQAPRRVIDDAVRLLAHLLGSQVGDETLSDTEVETVGKDDVLQHATLLGKRNGLMAEMRRDYTVRPSGISVTA